MDDGLQWYRRRPRAFLDGVQGMGPDLIGAYAVLLDLFYARGGLSLRDDRHLGGILGCSTRKAKSLTDALLERGKVVVRGEFITNSVAEKEAKSSRTTREAQAKGGRDGAEKRWHGKENNDLPIGKPINDPSLEKRREEKKERATDVAPKKTRISASSFPRFISPEKAQDYLDFRRAKRAPVTSGVMKALTQALTELHTEGIDPDWALVLAMSRNWQGFRAEWVRNEARQQRKNGDD